jgi:hypothetical protein
MVDANIAVLLAMVGRREHRPTANHREHPRAK